MADVWVVWPSANPDRHKVAAWAWANKGYSVGVLVDPAFKGEPSPHSGLRLRVPRYQGYWASVNELARMAFYGFDADIIVAAADDMFPDSRRAEVLAEQYLAKFPDGFGIMQPTGDDLDGTDRICGSPWIGRGWFEKAYGGKGPLPPCYGHFYGDEELLEVAKRAGVLWQRPDVIQRHEHWTRPGGQGKTDYQARNSDRYWADDRRTFDRRKGDGFPGAL